MGATLRVRGFAGLFFIFHICVTRKPRSILPHVRKGERVMVLLHTRAHKDPNGAGEGRTSGWYDGLGCYIDTCYGVFKKPQRGLTGRSKSGPSS